MASASDLYHAFSDENGNINDADGYVLANSIYWELKSIGNAVILGFLAACIALLAVFLITKKMCSGVPSTYTMWVVLLYFSEVIGTFIAATLLILRARRRHVEAIRKLRIDAGEKSFQYVLRRLIRDVDPLYFSRVNDLIGAA